MRSSITKESIKDALVEKRKDLYELTDKGIFIFTNKKHNGEFAEIGLIKCRSAYEMTASTPENVHHLGVNFIDFCFEDYLPLLDDGFYQRVEEGDILNIRTMINLIGNTYLVTFLLELDPLN